MLGPDTRTLLTEALCPPLGYVFDEGIAATYTLSLETLLTVPIHVVMQQTGNPRELAKDSVALLEALRRFSSKLTVYCDGGHIHVPASTNVLYSLLEPVVYEVRTPRGGAFHPKFWILRFTSNDESAAPPLLRLIVLSRNLTFDRSWDISVTLEGSPGRRDLGANRELADLVAALPKYTPVQMPADKRRQAARLADEVLRTEWDLPAGFEEYAIYVLGLEEKPWEPWQCKRLLLVSPFCTEEALETLADSADDSRTLISRQEQLDTLPASILDRFSCFYLDEAAETEDGDAEEGSEAQLLDGRDYSARGLHAKLQLAEKGWNSWVTLGSANTTDSALVRSSNVEILVELTGKTSLVKGIDHFLGPDGFADLLHPYTRGDGELDPQSVAARKAQQILEAGRRAICLCGLRLDVARSAQGEHELVLSSFAPLRIEKISDIRAWPVTVASTAAVDASALQQGEPIRLSAKALSSMCGFVAFQLTCDAFEKLNEPPALQFVLNVPLHNLPDGREAEIVRMVIENRNGFLRYLLLLLGDLQDFSPINPLSQVLKQFGFSRVDGAPDELPLLEHLVRAYSREPERLKSIKNLLEDLQASEEGKKLVPTEFLEVWRVFEELLFDPVESLTKTRAEEARP